LYIPSEVYVQIQEVLPIICVDAVITHNHRCLLLRRRNQPARGQLWFPGGRLYKNELIAVGVLRKCFEEVRLHCEFQSIISVEETLFPRIEDMYADVHTVNVCCHLIVPDLTEIIFDSQHEDYCWIDVSEAKVVPLHEAVRRPLLIALGDSAEI